jgi:hypothetical protein
VIDCRGVGKVQGKKILAILNKMLVKGVDTDAVLAEILAKEDEIIATQKNEAEEIRRINQRSWRELTDQEIENAARNLPPYVGIRIGMEAPNSLAGDRDMIVQQLIRMLHKANWGISFPIERPLNLSFSQNFQYGIQVYASEPNSKLCASLLPVLSALYGRDNIFGCFTDDPSMKGRTI